MIELAVGVYDNRIRKASTSQLNDAMLPEIGAISHQSALKGKYIKIKYITQLPTHSPTFVSSKFTSVYKGTTSVT